MISEKKNCENSVSQDHGYLLFVKKLLLLLFSLMYFENKIYVFFVFGMQSVGLGLGFGGVLGFVYFGGFFWVFLTYTFTYSKSRKVESTKK